MNDKLPSKFTGFFIALIGSGMILSLLSTAIDNIFLKNSEFSLMENENFPLIILGVSTVIGLVWLVKVSNLKD
tara:strand:+ start:814 stop:1032 length:219 start_codon:yes stop_codon:yes gene_type:complete